MADYPTTKEAIGTESDAIDHFSNLELQSHSTLPEMAPSTEPQINLFQTLPEVAPGATDTEKVPCDGNNGSILGKRSFHASRKQCFLGLTAAVVIVAIVVGTAVGIHKRNERSHGAPDKQPNTDDASSESLIWNQSALAVTGWRHDGKSVYNIRLFYQDAEGYLRISAMESAVVEKWGEGTRFIKAKKGTPLTASSHNQSIYDARKTVMETHIYYQDEQSKLQQFVFLENDEIGHNGDLGKQNITPAQNTRLASYWPSVIYQNEDNTLSEVHYNCSIGLNKCWYTENLDLKAYGPSAALAEGPLGTNFSGKYLFYQREDEVLVERGWKNDTRTWFDKEFAYPMPPSRPVAVFVTPRETYGALLNFFILYQASDDPDISFAWKNGGGWNQPVKDPALARVMQGTNIACLSPESWWDKILEWGSEMSRCYFIGEKGDLRQVQWDGSKWNDLGVIKSIGGRG